MPGSVTSKSTAERSRSPLWQWPLAAGAASAVAAAALSVVRPRDGTWLASLPGGDVDDARALLEVTATSVMTATTLTFSLTVVALQLASQQFSPRLLREFARDPITKVVLGVLTSAFAFSATGLLVLRGQQASPRLVVIGTFLLAGTALAALLAFITHIARSIRVDTMMLMVHDDTSEAIRRFYPDYDEASPPPPPASQLAVGRVVPVHAERSGFVQRTDVAALVECAEAHDAFVRIEVRAGDHVVAGTPFATAWMWGAAEHGDVDSFVGSIRRALTFGYERTLDQDTAFGLRQLEDIAVKAMSPAINDPVTAAHAVGHMADLLVRLVSCRLGPTVHLDSRGRPRAVVPDRDLPYYLDLACGQLRRFGSREPTVLAALLRMLRDVAVACRDDVQRAHVRAAAQLVTSQADGIRSEDMSQVLDLADRVDHALSGDLDAAYEDESGATRSM